jgi:hypothetical protein
VIFLKAPPAPLSPCFVVIDRLLPSDADRHEYQILWHTNTNALTIADDNLLSSHSQNHKEANIAIIAADHPALSLSIVTAQEKPEWQGWQSPYHGSQGTELPAPTADYRLNTIGAQRVVTLLYSLSPGTSCPVVRTIADTAITATDLILHLHDGASISLNENDF